MFCFDHCWSKVRYWDIYLCSYLLLSVLSHEKVVAPHYTGSSSANDCPIDKLPRPWQCCDHQYTIYYIYYLYCVMWPSVDYLSDVDTLGTQDQALCAQAVLCCPIDQRRVSRVILGNGECCCSNHFCSYIILSKSKPPYTLYRILESVLMIY